MDNILYVKSQTMNSDTYKKGGIHDKDSKDHFTTGVYYSFRCSVSQSEQ